MDFISILSIFVLACFVGYYVVWSVTPALHTPLMAVTNAISSVIIVGALVGAVRRVTGRRAGSACGGGAGQLQHLRRLRGDRADAGDVQEEGALRCAEHVGLPGLGAARLSRCRGAVHPRAARAVFAGDLAARQPLGHGRHGDRGDRHARDPRAGAAWRLATRTDPGRSDRAVQDPRCNCARRRDRLGHRAQASR